MELGDRFTALLTRTFENEKTRENYASRLRSLLKHMNLKGSEGLLEILEHPDIYYPKLQAAYPSLTTRKNMLTAILVLFREDEGLKETAASKVAGESWKKLHDDLARHQDVRVKRSEPEGKQIAKYTSFEEIEAKYEELKNVGGHGTKRKSQQFLLLSVLVHLRPKRADLGSIHLFYNKDPHIKDANYIVLRKKRDGSSFLVMNMYKTSKYYQTVEEDLPEGLVRDILTSVKRWPREYLFVKEDGEPMSNNTYTQFVQSVFKELFGRETGVSLLRHIYISEKLDFDDMTLEEQEEEARLMLHTSGLQRRYKWPKRVLCPKLCADYLPPTRRTRKHPKVPPAKSETRRKHRRSYVSSDDE